MDDRVEPWCRQNTFVYVRGLECRVEMADSVHPVYCENGPARARSSLERRARSAVRRAIDTKRGTQTRWR